MQRKIVVATLIALLLNQALPLVLWIMKDTAVPEWDESWHAMISVHRYKVLFDAGMRTQADFAWDFFVLWI